MATAADENTPQRGTTSKMMTLSDRITRQNIISNFENTARFGARSKNLTHTVNVGTVAGCCSCPITSRILQVEEKLEVALEIIAKQVIQ